MCIRDRHTAWTLPWDNRKSSEADVIQMYEEAIEKAAPVVEQIVKGFNGEGSDIQPVSYTHLICGPLYYTAY